MNRTQPKAAIELRLHILIADEATRGQVIDEMLHVLDRQDHHFVLTRTDGAPVMAENENTNVMLDKIAVRGPDDFRDVTTIDPAQMQPWSQPGEYQVERCMVIDSVRRTLPIVRPMEGSTELDFGDEPHLKAVES